MVSAIDIEFTEIGPDYLIATMPVNEKTIQPIGILHGGASLALIETIGSTAANLAVDRTKYVAVGQTVSCSHIKSVFKGDLVSAKATPIHIGKTSQVWDVALTTSKNVLNCKGQITLAIIPLEKARG